jgi:acylphosphatase
MSAGESAAIRRHLIYHGRVQGVSFRLTCRMLAGDFAITGYVRNQSDGTVELEAEGPAGEVTRFLDAVQREFAGNITHTDARDVTPRGDESPFEITY